MTRKQTDYETSSGNVFADLGLADSDELIAKAALARQIVSIATHRHLTQSETAQILGTTQPKVSDLFRGRLDGYSLERLMRYLNALDRDVRIVVTKKPRTRSHALTWVANSLKGARARVSHN
ncbi:MAG: XRE family transcriptional regulator [Deltaproteobacteria bacterium]|nr:XRE family transcriptional regulator [Deltaproteobacteria bacterium]